MPELLDQSTITRLEAASLTCSPDVHATADPPPGYWRLEQSRRLGEGAASFDRACDSLLSWQMHERAGFRVRPSEPPIVVGSVLVLETRIGFVRVLAPCRVVRVTREPDRCGFAYGTLAGHPVSGEEEFTILRDPRGEVMATVQAVSRPDWRIAKAGAALTRYLQTTLASSYLTALTIGR